MFLFKKIYNPLSAPIPVPEPIETFENFKSNLTRIISEKSLPLGLGTINLNECHDSQELLNRLSLLEYSIIHWVNHAFTFTKETDDIFSICCRPEIYQKVKIIFEINKFLFENIQLLYANLKPCEELTVLETLFKRFGIIGDKVNIDNLCNNLNWKSKDAIHLDSKILIRFVKLAFIKGAFSLQCKRENGLEMDNPYIHLAHKINISPCETKIGFYLQGSRSQVTEFQTVSLPSKVYPAHIINEKNYTNLSHAKIVLKPLPWAPKEYTSTFLCFASRLNEQIDDLFWPEITSSLESPFSLFCFERIVAHEFIHIKHCLKGVDRSHIKFSKENKLLAQFTNIEEYWTIALGKTTENTFHEYAGEPQRISHSGYPVFHVIK